MEFADSCNCWQITLTSNLPSIQYKFTRGNWQTVEKDKNGKEITNRSLTISRGTVVDTVETWNDAQNLPEIKASTASKNVHKIAADSFLQALVLPRDIFIYLPPDYEKKQERYPVVYMHDGQNLFDDSTAAFGEWGIDKYLDSILPTFGRATIVVGVPNSRLRMQEYNPCDSVNGQTLAGNYLQYLTGVVKPYIDTHYRTLPSAQNTCIAGSSMGGLISYYAMLTYPNIFGSAGIFSPSFFMCDSLEVITQKLAPAVHGKTFFYMGEKEGDMHVARMHNIADVFAERSNGIALVSVDEDGEHSEMYWQKAFPIFYQWLTANGANTVLPVEH